ncbi:hypothetical protein EaACW_3363 [Erwinia amylovora ACW56400]|nr:hypothetical protein EaACW_3363 [Erwinia amylovora ACW56400]CCO84006.1 hypothetical protein BN433_3459 [Erwinia amylovora Ea266]
MKMRMLKSAQCSYSLIMDIKSAFHCCEFSEDKGADWFIVFLWICYKAYRYVSGKGFITDHFQPLLKG